MFSEINYTTEYRPLVILGYICFYIIIKNIIMNFRVIAAMLDIVEESPCSHGSEMTVVFVLSE